MELVDQARSGLESEASIASLLEQLFKSQIFRALPTDGRDSLTVTREIERLVAKKGQRPDLLVVRKAKRDPIGVIAIEIPLYAELEGGERVGTLEKNVNIQQIRGYLNRLKAFDGVVHALGILSNYEEYRFCWFKESFALVAATNEDEAKLAIAATAALSNDLCLSRIYRFDESDMARRLAGWIWRGSEYANVLLTLSSAAQSAGQGCRSVQVLEACEFSKPHLFSAFEFSCRTVFLRFIVFHRSHKLSTALRGA